MTFLFGATATTLALAATLTQPSNEEFEKWAACNAAFTVGDLWTDDETLLDQNLDDGVLAMELAEKHGAALGMDFDEIFGRMNQLAETLTETGYDDNFEHTPELDALLKQCRSLIAANGK